MDRDDPPVWLLFLITWSGHTDHWSLFSLHILLAYSWQCQGIRGKSIVSSVAAQTILHIWVSMALSDIKCNLMTTQWPSTSAIMTVRSWYEVIILVSGHEFSCMIVALRCLWKAVPRITSDVCHRLSVTTVDYPVVISGNSSHTIRMEVDCQEPPPPLPFMVVYSGTCNTYLVIVQYILQGEEI